MRGRGVEAVVDRLRAMLLGNHSQVTARLERELAEIRRMLHDPQALRALVVAALHEEVTAAPADVAAALRPALDHLLRQRVGGASRSQWPWLSALLVVAAASVALMSWRGQGSMVSAATEHVPAPAPVAAVVPIIEERSDGFGLGHASRSDAELVRDVRARLAACPELIGARVAVSVTDGWVWLRGEASVSGRAAAARAVGDLGDGVVLVNQLVAIDALAAVAAR